VREPSEMRTSDVVRIRTSSLVRRDQSQCPSWLRLNSERRSGAATGGSASPTMSPSGLTHRRHPSVLAWGVTTPSRSPTVARKSVIGTLVKNYHRIPARALLNTRGGVNIRASRAAGQAGQNRSHRRSGAPSSMEDPASRDPREERISDSDAYVMLEWTG
jgi:hypothetical protein